MNKKIVLSVILLFFISFNSAEACSPPVDWNPQPGDFLFNSKTTFAGTVKGVNADVSKSTLEITLGVDVVFSGDVPHTEVTVVTDLGSSACGYEIEEFKKGDIWMIYSDDSGATLTIDSFSGSQKFESYEQVFDFEREHFPMMVGCGSAPDGTDLGSCYIFNRFEEVQEPLDDIKDNNPEPSNKHISKATEVDSEVSDLGNQVFQEQKKKNLLARFWGWITNLF